MRRGACEVDVAMQHTSFKVSKWRFQNASEFQDISVREFQFGETEYGE